MDSQIIFFGNSYEDYVFREDALSSLFILDAW